MNTTTLASSQLQHLLHPGLKEVFLQIYSLHILNQQSQYQMKQYLTQQRFLAPEVSESLPTFRQVGNYLNSISSASTIYLERDNTHTRLESELKINSNKPSLDSQIPHCPQKSQSDILSYSHTSSLLLFEDSLMHLQRLINLMSSRDNLQTHISQSLAINGLNYSSSRSIATTVTQSFSQYIFLASKVDFKHVREELNSNTSKIAKLNKDMMSAKQENLLLFEKIVRLEKENAQYRKKVVALKERTKDSQKSDILLNTFKDQCCQIMNKMTLFQSQIMDKFVGFQEGLIKVTTIRNKMLKNQAANSEYQQQSKRYEKENKKLKASLESKPSSIDRQAMKEINLDSNKCELQQFRKILREKSEEIVRLSQHVQLLSDQLNDQRNLYQQMLDKNIELEKELFMLGVKPRIESQSSQSFCIIDQDNEMKYMSEQGQEMVENELIRVQE